MAGRRRTLFVGLGVVLGLLVVLRLALPFIVLEVANRRLADVGEYRGHISDVDLAIIRGAYRVEGITFVKKGGDVDYPFLTTRVMDISIEWKALLRGDIVAEILIIEPTVNFVKGPTPETSQAGKGTDWQQLLQDATPVAINRMEVRGGEVHVRATGTKPPLDLQVHDLSVVARNLTNSEDLTGSMVATVDLHALVHGGGTVAARASVDPYRPRPTFDLALEVEQVPLPALNPLLEAGLRVDAEGGQLSLYSEVDSDDGVFVGYVKPLLEGVSIYRGKQEERSEGLLRKGWEAVVGTVVEVVENQPHDRVATRLPLEGRLEDPQPDAWFAMLDLLRNAFIQALRPGFEGQVQFGRTRAKEGHAVQ